MTCQRPAFSGKIPHPLRLSIRLISSMVISLGVSLIATSASANDDRLTSAGQVYGELGAGLAGVQIDNTDFDMTAMEARIGAYVYPNIGIEIQAATGVTEDTQDDLDLELEYSTNILARFETPERQGFKILLLAGYGQTSLYLDRSGTGAPGSETFKSANFGLGANYRWNPESPLSAGLKWHRYYAEGNITIELTTLSLNMDF